MTSPELEVKGIRMQANPDNGWIQIESIRLVGFEFEARRATIGWIQNSIVRT
jgi:hypothetical protein